MSKILLKINNDCELKYPANGYILGVDKYSFLFGKTFSVSKIKEIKESIRDKKIFACLNRIIFNDELDDYKNTLNELDKLGLDGIIVGDVAALTYDLKTDIVLDQAHLNNSYLTINHYYNNNAKGIYLTNDITKEEIKKIRSNTKSTLFKEVFLYPCLSISRRKLISNYKEYFNLDDKSDMYEINESKSNDYYKIVEDENGTYILGSKVLSLLKYDLDVDYEIISSYLIGDVKEVLDIFINKDVSKNNYLNEKYNCDEGFINKKTIYKVKKDEK